MRNFSYELTIIQIKKHEVSYLMLQNFQILISKQAFNLSIYNFQKLKIMKQQSLYDYTNRTLNRRKHNLINRQVVLSHIISLLLQKI